MKRIIALVLVIISLFTAAAFAEAPDYSFLDEMTLEELEALQKEVDSRIKTIKDENAADNPDDMGMWTIKYFVDEFKMPTDDGYVTNSEMIAGTFSNSATTNSDLLVKLIIDDEGYVQFFLYEYGRSQVKNFYSSKSTYYTIIMMDANGERHYMDAFMSSDRILLTDTSDNSVIRNALAANGTVRFAIEEDDDMTSYVFAIEDTSNFSNAYNALIND